MDKKKNIYQKDEKSPSRIPREDDLSSFRRKNEAEASPLHGGLERQRAQKARQEELEAQKNKKSISPSDKNDNRSPNQKTIPKRGDLIKEGQVYGGKGIDIAKKQDYRVREGSPGTINLEGKGEEESKNIFQRSVGKRRSTKNLDSSSIPKLKAVNKSLQNEERSPDNRTLNKNNRNNIPVSADYGQQPGHRTKKQSPEKQDERMSRSPNNPEYYEDMGDNNDDEQDQGYFNPDTHEITTHNQAGYSKGLEGKLVPRNTKVLGLINPDSSPGAFIKAKPKVSNRLSTFLIGQEKGKPKTPEKVTQFRDPNKLVSNSPNKKKFSRIAVAMMVSKGANCEDRVITRSMRGDESGGVVDLGTNTLKPGTGKKYEVKKFGGKKEVKKDKKRIIYNPNQRLKAAKIVQGWWRGLLSNYAQLDEKVIKIQSVWRGTWYRLHLYDILYYTYLIKAFVERIMVPIRKKVGKDTIEALLPWAQKYWVRKHYNTIIKVQSIIRGFLANMRNRKKRAILLLDKFYLQRLQFGLRKIIHSAQSAESKEKKRKANLLAFARKVAQKMRVRVFHDLFFKLFENATGDFRLILFKLTMKKHSKSFHIYDLRENFIKWMKRANIRNNKAAPFVLRILKKFIMKPLFDHLIERMRRKIPKGTKERIIRRLIRNADKFKEVVLQNYFNNWKILTTKMAGDEFKNHLTTTLLFKTKKKLDANLLSSCFRQWRTNVSNITDIKRFIKGLVPFKKGILRKVHKRIMPILSKCVDGIKARCTKALCMNFPKFNLITLRRYLKKWRKIHHRIGQLQVSSMFLTSLRRNNNSKVVYKMLIGRFQDWKRKTNILAFLEERDKNDIDRNKALGANGIVEHVYRYARQQAFKLTYPKLREYLNGIIKNRTAKALFRSNLKLNKTCLRIYFNKFKNIKQQADKKDLKNNFFRGILGKFSKSLIKKNMRGYFQRWVKQVKDKKEIWFNVQNGLEKLMRHYQRKFFVKPIIKCFKRKADVEHTREGMIKALGFGKKFQIKKLTDYLEQWKLRAQKLRALLTSHTMSANFMKSHLKSYSKRLMEKYFKHWKKKPSARLTLHQLFMRNLKMSTAAHNYCSKKLFNLKKDVFEKVKKKNGNNAIMKAYMKFIDYFLNGRKEKKKFWLRHWFNRAREFALRDVRQAIMKMAFKQAGFKQRSLYIGSFFFKWRNNSRVDGKFDNQKEMLRICQGFDKIDRFVKWKKIDFFLRLKRLMTLDTRGKVVLMLWKRSQRPRNSVAHLFERWRRVASKMDLKANERELKNKLTGVYMKKLGKRVDRDKLTKAFRHWKNRPVFTSNFLLNVTDAFNKINRAVKRKYLGAPFILINRQKNYKKLFTSLVPIGSNLAKTFAKKQLRKYWDHWIILKDKVKTDGYKMAIFTKTNGKFLEKLKTEALRNRFRYWAHLAKRQEYNYELLVKGFNLLNKRVTRPLILPFLMFLNERAYQRDKQRGLKSFLTSNAAFLKTALRYKLKAWYRKMLLFDDTSKPVAIRTFKRFVIEKYYTAPVDKYWRIWRKALMPKRINGPEMFKAVDHLINFILKSQLRKPGRTPFFRKLKVHRSAFFIEKALFTKLLPNCKNLAKKHMINKLRQWHTITKKIALKNVESKFFLNIYGKNQKALYKRFLREKLRIWRRNVKPKTQMDLRKVMWLVNKTYSVLAKKYLQDFITPNLREFSQKKFLRDCLMKNSRFHKRLLKPFVEKWRRQSKLLAAREMKNDFNSKIIGKTSKFYRNQTFQTILKNRIRIWRKNKNLLAEIEKQITPEFVACIVKFNLKKNVPPFLEGLKKNKISSLKKNISFGLLKKSGMMQKRILRNYFNKWLDQVKNIQLKEFKTGIVKSFLRVNNDKRNKTSLKRAFERFKVKQKYVASKNPTPYIIGNKILKNFLCRKPWLKFKKIAKNMNLVIPEGMNFSSALMRFGPNVAKAMIFRNMSMRPYFRQWKLTVEKMKLKDMEYELFKKLFLPNARNKGKTGLRSFFRRWKTTAQKMTTLDMKMSLKAGLMKNMYANNARTCVKHYIKKWGDQVRKTHDYLERVARGNKKLYSHMYGKDFRDFANRVIYKGAFDPTGVAKKIIMNVVANTTKGAILLAFNTWKRNTHKHGDLDLKRRMLGVFLKNQNTKGMYKNKFHLQDRFLLWKVRSNKSHYDKFSKIRHGIKHVNNRMRREFIGPLLQGLKKKAIVNTMIKRLNKLFRKHDESYKDSSKRMKFLFWRITIVKIRAKIKDNAFEMLREYAASNLRYRQFTLPIKSLCAFMTMWGKKKQKCADKINQFTRSGMEAHKEELDRRRRTDLRYFLQKLYEKEDSNMKRHYRLWKTTAVKIKINEAVEEIQAFLRKRLDNLHEGRKRYGDAIDHIRNYTNAYVVDKLKKHAKQNRVRQLLLRNIKDIPDNLKEEFLRKGIKRWYEELRKAKMLRGVNIINSGVRRFFCMKLKKMRLNRKLKTNSIVLKLLGKYLDKLKIYFLQWSLRCKSIKVKDASNKIQIFMKQKLNKILNAHAFDTLKHMFRWFVFKKIAANIEKSSKIQTDGGLKLMHTLKTIYYQRPFDQIKESSVRLGLIKQLGKVYPRILKAFRFHSLHFYMDKWKTKAHTMFIKKLIRLQNWVRGRWALFKAKCAARKSFLTFKYLKKMAKEEKLLLMIYLKQWAYKSKLMALTKAATFMQTIWKGNKSRRNLDKRIMGTKAKEVFRRLLIKNLNRGMLQAHDAIYKLQNNVRKFHGVFERKYIIDDVFDYGNAKIRNMLLFMMTKNQAYHKNHRNLKHYFDKFKRNGSILYGQVKKIQNAYLLHLANKKQKLRRHVKDLLLKLQKNYEKTDKGKLKIYFLQWLNKTSIDHVVSSTKAIQKYLRKGINFRKGNKIKTMFKKYPHWLVPFRMISGAKVKQLWKSIVKPKFPILKKKLHEYNLRKRLMRLFSKRFADMDESLRKLYMKKIFNDYYIQVRRLNIKRNASAVMIQSNFKRWKSIKRFNDFLRKLGLLNTIKRRYQNQLDYKFELYFNLWRRKNHMLNQIDAAKELQAYMKRFVTKAKKFRKARDDENITKGMEHMQTYKDIMLAKRAFMIMRDKIGGDKFAQMCIDLQGKVRDHRAWAFRRLKNYRKHMDTCAVKIQKAWKQFKFSRGIWTAVQKLRLMKRICKLMMSKELRLLNTAIKHWQKKAIALRLVDASKILQMFLRQSVIAYKKAKKQEATTKLKGLSNRNVIKNVKKVAKAYDNNIRFGKAYPLVLKYIWNKFKYRILNFDRLKTCSLVYDIRVKCIKKIMGYFLIKFRNKLNRIKLIRSIQMIQKNFRLFHKRRVLAMIKDKMDQLYAKYELKTNNKKKYYFLHLWRVAYLLKVKEATDSISEFTKKYLIRSRLAKKWRKVSQKLCIFRGLIDCRIMKLQIRRLIHLKRLFELCKKKMYKNFPIMCSNIRIGRLLRLIKAIFGDFKNRKITLAKSYYWKRWNNKVQKMQEREKVLDLALKKITLKTYLVGAQRLNDFFRFKQLLKLLCLVKGKAFFHKIHKYSIYKASIFKMRDAILKLNKQLTDDNISVFADKFNKVYTARILNNFTRRYLDIEETKYQPKYKRQFMRRMTNILYANSKYKYIDQKRESNVLAGRRKEVYNAYSTADKDAPKEKGIDSDPTFIQCPLFMAFFNDLIRRRKAWAFYNMKKNDNLKKVFIKIHKAVYKAYFPYIGKFMQIMKDRHEGNKLKPLMKMKLRGLCRRYAIKKLFADAEEIKDRVNLHYLLRLLAMQRDVVEFRAQKRAFRKWVVKSSQKEIIKTKMLNLYKNMQLQYLELSNQMFGSEDSSGVFEKMNKMNEKFEMFSGSFSSIQGIKRKHISKVNYQYVFEDSKVPSDGEEDEKKDEVVNNEEESK